MRLLLALSALLLFACEKEVPRYPDTKVYPETKTVTPPPAATTTPRPPVHAEPSVPPPSGESKPGETKQVEKPQK